MPRRPTRCPDAQRANKMPRCPEGKQDAQMPRRPTRCPDAQRANKMPRCHAR